MLNCILTMWSISFILRNHFFLEIVVTYSWLRSIFIVYFSINIGLRKMIYESRFRNKGDRLLVHKRVLIVLLLLFIVGLFLPLMLLSFHSLVILFLIFHIVLEVPRWWRRQKFTTTCVIRRVLWHVRDRWLIKIMILIGFISFLVFKYITIVNVILLRRQFFCILRSLFL